MSFIEKEKVEARNFIRGGGGENGRRLKCKKRNATRGRV